MSGPARGPTDGPSSAARRRAARLRHLTWVALAAWILAIGIAASPHGAAAAGDWSIVASPVVVTKDVPATVTLTVENLRSGGTGIECVVFSAQHGWTMASASVVDAPSGRRWSVLDVNRGNPKVSVAARTDGDALERGERLQFSIQVTATSTHAASWDARAFSSRACSRGRFATEPTVTVAVKPDATEAPTATPKHTPKPTKTPKPVASPTPRPTPRNSPKITPTPTPTPSPTARPTPRNSPRPTPSPTPTPTPTTTPVTTATPSPTPTFPPTPSPTPRSSAAPSPTRSPSSATPTLHPGWPGTSLPPATPVGRTPAPSRKPPPSDAPAATPAPDPTPSPDTFLVGGAPVRRTGSTGGGSAGGPAVSAPPEESTDVVLADIHFAGSVEWAVPAAVLAIPGLFIALSIGAQVLGGVVWIPVARRVIGERRRARSSHR